MKTDLCILMSSPAIFTWLKDSGYFILPVITNMFLLATQHLVFNTALTNAPLLCHDESRHNFGGNGPAG